MQVGINYPWLDYGWDFGDAPPGWRSVSHHPNWMACIESELEKFSQLGITVVRWFILADGLTYGVRNQAPYIDPSRRHPNQWRFDHPPELSAEFLEHFEALLQKFEQISVDQQRNIQLLPVLIDFKFCEPGVWAIDPKSPDLALQRQHWVKQGRGDLVLEPTKRDLFLKNALHPLLLISQKYRSTIYAWELINEPEWVTQQWNPWLFRNLGIDRDAMTAFLRAGIQYIQEAGFKATIGFAKSETISTTKILADFNQFHYYPNGRESLEMYAPNQLEMIGELATSSLQDRWPELSLQQQSVLHRVGHAKVKGYPISFLWSYNGKDRHTQWDASTERAVQLFTEALSSGDL